MSNTENVTFMFERVNMLAAIANDLQNVLKYQCTLKTVQDDALEALSEEGDQTMAKHRIRVCVGYNDDGSLVTMQVSGNTQFELADNVVRALLNSNRRSEFVTEERDTPKARTKNVPSFRVYTEEWQKTYKDDKQRDNTKAGYRSYLHKHIYPTWGTTPINQIETKDIQSFLNDRKELSAKTLREMLGLLKQIFDSAVEDKLLSENPAKSSRITNPGKPSRKREALSKSDVQEVLSKLDILQESDRRFMALLIYTGMRKGELIGLRWQDIDLANNVIHVTQSANVNKGKAVLGATKSKSGTRDIPIAPDLRKYLVPVKSTGYVVVGVRDSSGSAPISGTTYNQMVARIEKTIDLRGATAHTFRHTMGTMLYDAGQNVKTVQAIMGHSDFKTTADRYVHPVEERKQEAMIKVSQILASS